jgi:hypothetical protein
LLGWVGSRIDAGFEPLDANLATLERLLGSPPLAILPPLDRPGAAEAAAWLDRPRLQRALGVAG